MFLYGATPENPTFAPSYDATVSAETDLYNATRDLQLYRDNANSRELATGEAYERRNRAIFEATGVQLDNPYKQLPAYPNVPFVPGLGSTRDYRGEAVENWNRRARDLAGQRPEFAEVIGLDRPIEQDAFAVSRGAEAGMARASAEADAARLGGGATLSTSFAGGIAGMIRDPLQVATLTYGGGISGPSKFVGGRILQMMFSEAIVNGGVEAAVQASSQEWRRAAGVESGFGPALEQVGLAALFGGGFGGLVQGGSEVFRLLGKVAPEEALARVAAGETAPGDVAAIGEALGLKLDPETARVAELAAEQPALDRAAFGEPPAGLADHEAETLAAQALRAAEDDTPSPIGRDMQQRAETVDRIVQREMPVGPVPKKPVTLMQFLAGRSVGGIADEGGALASMGLSRKFVPGGGALVRKNGKSLDYAREAAAEAGYFDDIYGDPARAVAESTPDDLLRYIERERDGEPVFSDRNDGGRSFEWLDYDQRQRAQGAYRRIVEEVDSAIDTLGIEDRLDDALLIRAAELVDDETDAVTALERALDEDYRNYADALNERGEGGFDDADIPFFGEDAGPVPRDRGADGQARPDGEPGGRGADAPDGDQLPGARSDEGQALERQPLRAAGDTPEPASPEAGQIAELALTEARRSEPTAAGEQTLIEGVAPVSTKQKLEAQAAKPMRGGDKAPPAGGLFDEGARQQVDMWDAMPATRDADGSVSHVTHADMVDDASRDEFFGDLIASCKD